MTELATKWKCVLRGGPHDGTEWPLDLPYPLLKTPEGNYRQVERDIKNQSAVYEWIEGE